MGNNGSAVLIVGVILIGLVLFGGVLIGAVSGLIPQLEDFIQQIIDSLQGIPHGGGGEDIQGASAISFVVYFSDGTHEDINGEMSYSLLPLTIKFNNKTVARIEVNLLVKLSGEEIDSWTVASSMHTELYKKTETTPKISSTANYTKSGAEWQSGTIKTVASWSVEASELDTITKTYGAGGYLLQETATLELELSVGGESQHYDAQPVAGGLDFTYQSGVSPPYLGFSCIAPKTTLEESD